eukprot:gene57799-biopygen112428
MGSPPQHLSVEHLLEPPTGSATLLAIDVPRPRFGWRVVPNSTTDRGVAQSAYRLQLARSGGALVWDSGRVSSNCSVLVELPAVVEGC